MNKQNTNLALRLTQTKLSYIRNVQLDFFKDATDFLSFIYSFQYDKYIVKHTYANIKWWNTIFFFLLIHQMLSPWKETPRTKRSALETNREI